MSKKILVVGELNIDLILNNIQGFPTIGHEILAETMNLTLGSSSAIFASNIATLGVNTSFCGMVGKDNFGKFILEELQKNNVDTSYVVDSSDHKTGITVVLNYSQDRANVTHCGAMNNFNIEHIPLDHLSKFSHLHFSSYFLQKGIQPDVIPLFKAAKEQGLTTSLDVQWDPENRWNFPYKECLPFIDIFLPNESELMLLTAEKDLDKALKKIGTFSNKMVVKRGTMGSLAYEKGSTIAAAPFLHDHFVDAIGAGDSFNAGFIYKFLSGSSSEESLRFANLCGAINTTEPGGTTAFASYQSFKKKAAELFNVLF